MTTLTFERLRELLHYDPETGIFTRLVSCGSRALAGSVANSTNIHGYVSIMIDGRRYYGHRLAWLYVHGEWPIGGLDHKDLDKSNNAIKNLRPATQSQNIANTRMRRTNTSGFKGVSLFSRTGRWTAVVAKQRLGYFHTPEAAHAAYVAAAQKLFGEFARAE